MMRPVWFRLGVFDFSTMNPSSDQTDAAADADVLVTVEGLSRRYGPTPVVENLSFTLRRGQVLGLLGLNGAGKSTTLRMLAGVLAPDAGRIVIAGADLLDQPRQARRALGYLPEQPPLYRELTVDEQLRYSARLHGLDRRTSQAAVARVKEQCGLGAVGRRLTGQLSKGYRQRVGIAQALAHDPAVLILDEPTAGLDPLQTRELRALISDLGRQHGVILSTHLLPDVQAACSHVQILRTGRLVYHGALADWRQPQAAPSLRISLAQPPPLAMLAQLPGVAQVEELSVGRFRLHRAAETPVAALSAAVLEQARLAGWELYELTPERRDLEHLFADLVLGENAT